MNSQMEYFDYTDIWRLVATVVYLSLLSLSSLAASGGTSKYEVRGEVLPHSTGQASLHSVVTPFAISVLVAPDGAFRFKNVEPGPYIVSVYVPGCGEMHRTVDVGPGTADHKGRVLIKLQTQSAALNRNEGSTISVHEWKIPDRAWREYRDSAQKIAKRDFEGATVCLQRALEIAPHFATAWNQLGTRAYQEQRYTEAETYFRHGINADPEAYEPLVNLGGVLINLGKLRKARECNTEAVRRRPQDALAQSQLGLTCLMLNNLEAAEKHLLLAIQLDPGHFSHPQLSLAEVYIHKRDFRRAADQLESFLHYHPDWPGAAKMRAIIERWRQ